MNAPAHRRLVDALATSAALHVAKHLFVNLLWLGEKREMRHFQADVVEDADVIEVVDSGSH